MATVVIGSASMELEKTFRMMMIELARNLTIGECEQVAYIANVRPVVTASEFGNPDYRVNLLSTLESQARIGPLKLDFLEEVFRTSLKRQDLLGIITRYKEKQCYKKAVKKQKKKAKKKKQDQGAARRFASSRELSAQSSSRMCHFQETFQVFLTQFAQMTLSIRTALETRNLAMIEDAFHHLIKNGDAVTQTLREKPHAAGINRLSDSSSSGESSGK